VHLPALRRSTHWFAEDRCRAPRWKRLVLSSDIMGARARGGLQLGDYKYELTYTPNYLHSLGRPWP